MCGRRTQRVWGVQEGEEEDSFMVCGRSSTRTCRVWARSTTAASWMTREGRVTSLLQARSLDAAGLGGARWPPLL
jgi:hypothetical protein